MLPGPYQQRAALLACLAVNDIRHQRNTALGV